MHKKVCGYSYNLAFVSFNNTRSRSRKGDIDIFGCTEMKKLLMSQKYHVIWRQTHSEKSICITWQRFNILSI